MINFTDTFIKRLKPQEKRVEKFEGGGFGILIYPAGTKSWIYRYKINNKKDYIIFGHYPNMGLAEARKRFGELREIRRTGTNPKLLIEQELNREKYTVAKLVTSWYENYVEKNRKQPLQIKYQIEADIIPLLGDLELEKIQPLDISMALDIIVKRGAPILANRILSTLKQLFNYAVSRGRMQQNPATHIRARDIGGPEKPRERYLTLDEINMIWHFLNSDLCHMSLQTKNAIKIIILTGVRTAEIRLAEWKNIDFENSLWTIPPEHTKGAITVKIHLTNLTKSIFEELKSVTTSSFVLPGLIEDQPLDKHALPRAIRRIQTRVGIPEWTAHDLRRTFATQLGESLHVDPVVIEKCLGHKMPKIMATYNKNEMLPQRKEALEKWAICIQECIGYNSEITAALQNCDQECII
ncbi:tyrosine-type recombinase/integrase [Legionella tucsonensis]|uniref:Integrase n=1 Tax=Legionella tucsonensis TaxID=40335 RepID=A0A0W0ZXF3_9GAMM|nr:site-specific integrase [Legionella tucsonensis]KTD73767.1 integrase [Legionella tucsonensis]